MTAKTMLATVGALALASCVAVPQYRESDRVADVPGSVHLAGDTVIIDTVEEKSRHWFVVFPLAILEIVNKDYQQGTVSEHLTFRTDPKVSVKPTGSIVIDLSSGACRRRARHRHQDSPDTRRAISQREVPTSFEKDDLEIEVDDQEYTLRVVRDAGRTVLRVSDRSGELRRIDLGELETKIYWIESTDLIQTVGHLASLSTGALYRHDHRYLRAFVDGARVFIVTATGLRGPEAVHFLELSHADLTVARTLYRGNDWLPVDFDGRRFLFLGRTDVAAYDTRTDRWQRASFDECL